MMKYVATHEICVCLCVRTCVCVCVCMYMCLCRPETIQRKHESLSICFRGSTVLSFFSDVRFRLSVSAYCSLAAQCNSVGNKSCAPSFARRRSRDPPKPQLPPSDSASHPVRLEHATLCPMQAPALNRMRRNPEWSIQKFHTDSQDILLLASLGCHSVLRKPKRLQGWHRKTDTILPHS